MSEVKQSQIKPYDLVKKQNILLAHQQAINHRRVSLVGSKQYKDSNPQYIQKQITCSCCQKTSQPYININFKIQSLGFLGAGYPLYFVFNKLCCTLLFTLFIVTQFNKTFYFLLFEKKKKRMVNQSDFMALVMFGMCVLITVFYGWYMSYLAIVIDQNDTSPEDYSVRVANIPIAIEGEEEGEIKGLKIEEELKQFFETQYNYSPDGNVETSKNSKGSKNSGNNSPNSINKTKPLWSSNKKLKVVDICLCYNLDPLSKMQKKRQVLINALKKTTVSYDTLHQKQIIAQVPYHGLTQNKILLKQDKLLHNTLRQRIDNLITNGFHNNKIMFTGEAIISFQKQAMKEYVENSDAAAYFYGEKLRIYKAENPKNIFWYNLHLDAVDYKIRKILSIVCCSCILMTSLLIQILMNYIKISITGTKYETKIFNYFTAIIVNLMNIIIPGVFLRFFSRFEGHRTHSEEMLSFSKKCIWLQMMNTLIVPLIVYNLFKTNEEITYIEKQYGVLSRNELFGFIMTVIPMNIIIQQVKIFLFQKGIYVEGFLNKNINLQELCKLYQYLQFGLQKKYCDSIKSVMLAFAFGIDLPKVILYAFINMLLSGYIHRYYLVRFTTVKHNVSPVLNQELFPLLYIALALFLMSKKPSPIKAILILISLSFYFLPIITKMRRIVNRKKNEKDKDLSFNECLERKVFETDYMRENPAMAAMRGNRNEREEE